MTRIRLHLVLVAFLLSSVMVYAQRPGAFSTLTLTDTTADSLHVGCAVGSSTCTGGIKSGPHTVTTLTASGTIVGGDLVQVLASGTGTANLEIKRTAGTATDWFIYAPTGSARLQFFGAAADAIAFFGGSGGINVGSTADPGAGIIASTGGFVSPAAFVASSVARGTGNVTGNAMTVGYNTSGGGAAGILTLVGKGGASNVLWADASAAPGMLRISTAAPDEDGTPSDTSGTVVGTQASTRDVKNIINRVTNPRSALDAVLRAPVYRFTYKGGSYNGTIFTGIIADEFPGVMMDPDAKHPDGKSFSPVSAFGYTALSIQALQAEIDALRREVRALQRARHP